MTGKGLRRIMIVEDEHIVAQDLASMVQNMGYEVSAILDNGQEAVERARMERPDLALMDIVLSGNMDGIEAASKLRMDHHLPIIYLTAYSDGETIQRAKQTQPHGYILKPFEEREIKTAIEIALFKGEMEEKLRTQQSLLEQKLLELEGARNELTRQNKQLAISRQEMEFERRRYQELFDLAPDGYLVTDLDGTIRDANSTICRMCQRSRDSIIGNHLSLLFAGENHDNLSRVTEQSRRGQTDRIEIVEAILQPHQGAELHCSLTVNVVTKPDGAVAGLRWLVHDISEQKRADDALRQSEERFRTTLYSIGDAVITTDTRGMVLQMNSNAESLTGWTEAEAVHETIEKILVLMSEDSGTQMDNPVLRALAVNRMTNPADNTFLISRSGTSYPIAATASPIHDSRGKTTGAVLVFNDQSQNRELQSRLLQTRKMDAVGRLAGGVAHDFNNMIGVILGFATRIRQGLNVWDPLHKDVSAILDAAQRCANLTTKLLTLASKQFVTQVTVNLNDTLNALHPMLTSLIGEDVTLVLNPADGLWTTKADPTQVDQIVTNLATNARDAITSKGTITIETRNAIVDEEFSLSHPGISPGEYVILTFNDTGAGMDKSVQRRIFEPFFTTKPHGQGTGLGLATVFGIVKRNSGFIDVESAPDQGTIFDIYFPRSREAVENPIGGDEEETMRGSETVLVVEDERLLLSIIKDELEFLGYTVHAADSPEEAIVLCERHKAHLDLVVTDVIMPGMNGRELSDQLTSMKPGLRVIFMSGHTADVVAERGITEDGTNFLQKPFTPLELAKKMRFVLDK